MELDFFFVRSVPMLRPAAVGVRVSVVCVPPVFSRRVFPYPQVNSRAWFDPKRAHIWLSGGEGDLFSLSAVCVAAGAAAAAV